MFIPQGIPESKDTAPQKLVEGLDFDKMKAEYGVVGASLNGPKYWFPDWTDIEEGVTRKFNGIEATWCAQLGYGRGNQRKQYIALHATTYRTEELLGLNKGTKVLLLDDPEGNTWIMKGFELGIKPQHTYRGISCRRRK